MFPSFGQSEIRLTTRTPKKETKMWSLADQCVRIAQHIEHVLNMNTTLLASHRQPRHRLSLVFDSYLEGLAALANHRILGDLPICPDTIHINSRKSRGQGRENPMWKSMGSKVPGLNRPNWSKKSSNSTTSGWNENLWHAEFLPSSYFPSCPNTPFIRVGDIQNS